MVVRSLPTTQAWPDEAREYGIIDQVIAHR